ncbi:MAG: hypothetical protein CML06_02870 [Pseudomonadales bacterium]|nr:hypothetical protein [Pseudomonadales bacterium]
MGRQWQASGWRSLLNRAWVVVIMALLASLPAALEASPVSQPGHYQGYSEARFGGWRRSSQYVAVSDGTRLAMDLFRPVQNGKVVEEPLPVIFIFTPYGRGMSLFKGVGGEALNAFTPVGSYIFRGGLTSLVRYGYVIACADVRGLGASYGSRAAGNDRVEARDARDLIEWLDTQPFSDGNVGMWGASYFGQTVLEAISTNPPYLKAAYFGVTNFNYYDAWARGGITRGSAGEVAPDPEREVKFAVPVDGDVDADGDGYPDQLWEAVNQHLDNGAFTGLLRDLPYRDSLSPDYLNAAKPYWEDTSASNYLDTIERSGVAAYVFGAWYDFLRRDTVMTFANWPNPVKMLITQGVHGDSIIGSPFRLNQLAEVHRFFDYWLKGIDNGIMDEPPVYYATLTTPKTYRFFPGWRIPRVKRWQFAASWPPPDVATQSWFLGAGPTGTAPSVNDGSLLRQSPAAASGSDRYRADFSITTDLEPVVGASVPGGAEFDRKGLTYTSPPLRHRLTLDGLPVMNLWLAADNRDADIFVVLEDVAPDGTSHYVSDGRLRASLRQTHTPPYDFLGLPWHRAYARDENLLTPGQPVRLEITMMPSSYEFPEGHRLRLVVLNAMGKVFNMTPQTNPDAAREVRVYRSQALASYLSLPVSNGTAAETAKRTGQETGTVTN